MLIFTSSFSEKINSIRPFKSLRKILELCSFSFLIRKDGVSVFIVFANLYDAIFRRYGV